MRRHDAVCIASDVSLLESHGFHLSLEPHWKGMVMWVWVTAFAPCAAKPRSGHTCPCELPSPPYSPPCASGHSRSFLLSYFINEAYKIKNPGSTSVYTISMSSSHEQCFYCSAKAAYSNVWWHEAHTNFPFLRLLVGFGRISFFFF